jgi:hypothetical protein
MAGKNTKQKDKIELDPKGWERFERAVDAAVKTRHRTAQARRSNKRPLRKAK